ncbi:hypothetical protein BDB01DRAFT_894718 [Pilobolus umbonatus]|nr:hypothetical protein BDB01DRAFT_894718 [Pilobolus umbonatus]
MSQTFHTYIDKYIGSVTIYLCIALEKSNVKRNYFYVQDDLLLARKVIKSLSLSLLTEEDNHPSTHDMESFELLLQQTQKSYSSHIAYNSSEDALNQLFVWPYLDIIGKTITLHNFISDFVRGQPYWKSMSRQLKSFNLSIDDENQYKSDETSDCLINKDKNKSNFDHHKDVFGTLAMLSCIADDYSFAFIEHFTKEVKRKLEEVVENLAVLKKGHNSNKRKYRDSPERPILLSETINPHNSQADKGRRQPWNI